MRFLAIVPLVLFSACQRSATPDMPRFQEPGAIAGSYQSTPPAADAGGRILSLDLKQDGAALFTTEQVGVGEPVVEKGRWSADGMDVTVQLFAKDSREVRTTLTWTKQGKSLVPKKWDKSLYGEGGLPFTLRL